MILREVKLPTSKYAIKCPHEMKNPIGVVVHNTYNTSPAKNEIAYMQRNGNQISFHYAVDETEAIQGLPLDRCSWNAGDGGNGPGNRKHISVEICRSRSDLDLFLKAEANGAYLVARILKQYGWNIDQVKKHQDFSGKYCPHRTLDLGWQRFLDLVQGQLDLLNGITPKPAKAVEEDEEKIIDGAPVGVLQGIEKSYPQKGRFYPDFTMNVRDRPSLQGNVVTQYPAGSTIPSARSQYYRVHEGNGYVWIEYLGASGNKRYVAVRPINKPRGYWGPCR